ncbi:hypothetical protein N7517_003787 [Penicillium concentricum]|uniref:Lipocalin-like domain-containing protein n=1 Tax=Penicillium concentricum TaxID=293559 RepID=A0A9W9S4B6_9EURO|nr:uncharacterized protein N7517_003787 [Penicillium concentricum]KAJ5371781.1 hypothetical protein N7517_003787 [Penicillium concentricum]
MSSLIETRQSLVGTWILVEYKATDTETGQVIHPMGPKAQGFLIYSADGFVSAHLMQPGAPAFSGNDMERGTQEELAESMKHYLAYCGRYNLEEVNGAIKVKHNMEVASFPNWLGNEQGRLVTLNGNNLELDTANVYLIDGQYVRGSLVWRKAQSTADY